jgi:hypothetical protein
MKYIVIILLILIFVFPFVMYTRKVDDIHLNCDVNAREGNVVRGEGFVIVEDILSETCRQKLVDTFLERAKKNKNLNEDVKLNFYSNEKFLKQLSQIVGEKLYPVNSLDLQRCWLRYYFEGMKAQYYENYHHDIKRYGPDVKQYRLVIPIHDTSDTVFSIEGYDAFPFKENMGVFLEASNCLHKVEFKTGERLLLIMDFINKPCDDRLSHYTCRNVNGYLNWFRDVLWRNISSKYYKIVNS